MKNAQLFNLRISIEELYDWVEELHSEVHKLKQGGDVADSQDVDGLGFDLFRFISQPKWVSGSDSSTGETKMTDWEDDAEDVYADLLNILISKQNDYGPDNIRLAPGGPLNGLRVRLYDKIARLSNLIDTGATPENESLRDTFIDIANYGVIGVMILDDTFPKSKD